MGQLVVEQRLLVLANKLAELAFEPGGGWSGESSAVGHGGALQPRGSSGVYLRLATAWMCVSRCILKV